MTVTESVTAWTLLFPPPPHTHTLPAARSSVFAAIDQRLDVLAGPCRKLLRLDLFGSMAHEVSVIFVEARIRQGPFEFESTGNPITPISLSM